MVMVTKKQYCFYIVLFTSLGITLYLGSVAVVYGVNYIAFNDNYNMTDGCTKNPKMHLCDDKLLCYNNRLGPCFLIGLLVTVSEIILMLLISAVVDQAMNRFERYDDEESITKVYYPHYSGSEKLDNMFSKQDGIEVLVR